MKLLRVAISLGDKDENGYEMAIKSLSNPELLEFCTPVVFGSFSSVKQHYNNVQIEQPISFNIVKNASDAMDGRPNILDCSPEESLSLAVSSYMNNSVDLVVALQQDISTDEDRKELSCYICKSIEADLFDTYNWLVEDNLRILTLFPVETKTELGESESADTFKTVINNINKALRKDFGLIKPRIAVVSGSASLASSIKDLQEQDLTVFGPFDAQSFIGDKNYLHYDAVLLLNEEKSRDEILNSNVSRSTVGYISGLPFVLTYPILKQNSGTDADVDYEETKPIDKAIFAGLDIYHRRHNYIIATHKPLEKQWIPRGKDDYKLDLTKDED